MKWYKFLIYFSLFAACVLNCIIGITHITGNIYGGEYEKNAVYYVFEGLQALDIIFGIAVIAFGAFNIYTRQALAKFKKNGPKTILICYAGSAALNLIYALIAFIIVNSSGIPGAGAAAAEILGSVIPSLFVSIIMVIVNNIYFKKRESMFIY